jgi:hypothetical protein
MGGQVVSYARASTARQGKDHDALERRPKLKTALADAKRHKCPVLVSKRCRLGRDVHFISGLTGVPTLIE